MKIYRDQSLSNFEWWSGAIANAREFTEDELDEIEPILESEYPDGIDETELNDIMWFEPEYLASLIDLKWDTRNGCAIRDFDDEDEE